MLSLPNFPLSELANHYKIFPIKQGSKTRIIQEPLPELKKFHKSLLPFFNEFPFYPGCTARSGMSVLDNAAPHHGAKVVFKTDIESFYPSITLEHLLRNFDVANTAWQERARLVVGHCLIPVRGRLVLPTGAPTSPILSNIAASDMDLALLEIATWCRYRYTRYIDDLTFSSTNPDQEDVMAEDILETINKYGFKWKKEKTGWFYPNHNQKFQVTGVTLLGQAKYKVPRELRRMLRVRLDKIAQQKTELDKATNGYLSYVRMLDIEMYDKLNNYLEERRAHHECPK